MARDAGRTGLCDRRSAHQGVPCHDRSRSRGGGGRVRCVTRSIRIDDDRGAVHRAPHLPVRLWIVLDHARPLSMSLVGTIESMNKRIKTTTIIDAICHKQLFGSLPAFSNLDSWTSWLVWLKSIYALPMDDAELAIYQQCTGRTQPPATQPSEIYTICGRRGGKSFISSLTAVLSRAFPRSSNT